MTVLSSPTNASPAPVLPAGVRLCPLQMYRDQRGIFTELFRKEWKTGMEPVQWSFLRSEADALRGEHVHLKHMDYLVLVEGRSYIGLRDLREESPTQGVSALVEMRGEDISALIIPPGVAHGFYSPEPSSFILGVSHYFDPADELGCHWSDPALEIPWPTQNPITNERDANAQPLSELLAQLKPWQPIAVPSPEPEP